MLSRTPFVLLRITLFFNPLSANPTKWSNTLKQFVGKLPTNCLSVFDHIVILAEPSCFHGDHVSCVWKIISLITSYHSTELP